MASYYYCSAIKFILWTTLSDRTTTRFRCMKPVQSYDRLPPFIMNPQQSERRLILLSFQKKVWLCNLCQKKRRLEVISGSWLQELQGTQSQSKALKKMLAVSFPNTYTKTDGKTLSKSLRLVYFWVQNFFYNRSKCALELMADCSVEYLKTDCKMCYWKAELTRRRLTVLPISVHVVVKFYFMKQNVLVNFSTRLDMRISFYLHKLICLSALHLIALHSLSIR